MSNIKRSRKTWKDAPPDLYKKVRSGDRKSLVARRQRRAMTAVGGALGAGLGVAGASVLGLGLGRLLRTPFMSARAAEKLERLALLGGASVGGTIGNLEARRRYPKSRGVDPYTSRIRSDASKRYLSDKEHKGMKFKQAGLKQLLKGRNPVDFLMSKRPEVAGALLGGALGVGLNPTTSKKRSGKAPDRTGWERARNALLSGGLGAALGITAGRGVARAKLDDLLGYGARRAGRAASRAHTARRGAASPGEAIRNAFNRATSTTSATRAPAAPAPRRVPRPIKAPRDKSVRFQKLDIDGVVSPTVKPARKKSKRFANLDFGDATKTSSLADNPKEHRERRKKKLNRSALRCGAVPASLKKKAALLTAPKETVQSRVEKLKKRLSTKNPVVDSFERKMRKPPGMPKETNTIKAASFVHRTLLSALLP